MELKMENLQTYIGTLAVERGYITQEKLNACIAILDAQDESIRTIDEILLENQYISPKDLKNLKSKRKLNIKKLEDKAVAEYIKKMKLVTSEQMQRCIDVQNKARQQGKYIPLSLIFVSHGILKQEAVDNFIKSREVQRLVREAICKDDPRRTGLIGRVLGGYEIESKIAAGGMGVVYRALQLELGRYVALKILFQKFVSMKKHLKQFFREAQLSAMLNHPNLVHIFEMGSEQGFFYYSMELVEGTNLGDYLKEKGRFPQEEAMDIITQAGRGLEHIHSFDVVHRDIKPSNFIIRDDGIVKIMDLGLARQLYKVSKKAATMGTPYYMSPELIHNPKEADHRADIYALGVSFYKMLTGDYPVTGRDAKEILKNISEQIPKPLSEYEDIKISFEIAKVVKKMLAKDPNERYQNMTDVLSDLDRILLV